MGRQGNLTRAEAAAVFVLAKSAEQTDISQLIELEENALQPLVELINGT